MIGEHGPAPHGEELFAGGGGYGDGVVEGVVAVVARREVDVAELLVDCVEGEVWQRVLIARGDADFETGGAEDVIASILRVGPAGSGGGGDESIAGRGGGALFAGAQGDADDVGAVGLDRDGAAFSVEDEGLTGGLGLGCELNADGDEKE